MKLFSNICIKRNTAFVVLLVWIFALGSGVANACLLEVGATHSHLATTEDPEATHQVTIAHSHSEAVANHDDDSHPSKAPCMKACDDGSRAMPKQDLTVVQTDPGPPPLVAVLWTEATPVHSMLDRPDGVQYVIPALPIRVRYLRLAL